MLEQACSPENPHFEEKYKPQAAVMLNNIAINIASQGIWATARDPGKMGATERTEMKQPVAMQHIRVLFIMPSKVRSDNTSG